MEYTDYSVEDFIRDEYFQKWIIHPDNIALDFWQKWIDDHPDKKEVLQCAINLMLLLCNENTFQLHHFDADTLWQKILQKKDKIDIDIPESGFTSKKYSIRNKSSAFEKNYNKRSSGKKEIRRKLNS